MARFNRPALRRQKCRDQRSLADKFEKLVCCLGTNRLQQYQSESESDNGSTDWEQQPETLEQDEVLKMEVMADRDLWTKQRS